MTDLSHIPTPRTNAQHGGYMVTKDFARQLERELSEALRERAGLREALQNISSNAEQNSIGGDGDDELIVSLNWIQERADEALLATEPKTE